VKLFSLIKKVGLGVIVLSILYGLYINDDIQKERVFNNYQNSCTQNTDQSFFRNYQCMNLAFKSVSFMAQDWIRGLLIAGIPIGLLYLAIKVNSHFSPKEDEPEN
jgi:hypothetical protein